MLRHFARLAALAGLAMAGAALAQSVTVYRGATLIDGTGAAPRAGMAVVVRGETIEAVVPVGALRADREATVIDLGGKWLLTGLIDAHQHLATPPNRARAEAILRRQVYSGVTSIRIMADDLRSIAELARASRAGEIPAPDLHYAALVAGPGFFADKRTQAISLGWTPGEMPWAQAIDPNTDIPLAIARARGTGAIALKIYADLPKDLIDRLTAEAHRQKLPVWALGMVFPTRPADVIAAGPDVISHTCYLGYQIVANPPATYAERSPIDAKLFGSGDHPGMTGLFTEMKRRGIILDATLRVYRESERQAATTRKPPYCTLDLAARLTAQAHRQGVAISAGTDGETAPDAPWPALLDEIELLVAKSGFTPMQAIESATRVAAEASAQGKSEGVIAAGRLANLVVLDRDPIADIANIRSVVLTVKRGKAFPRGEFK